MSTTWKLRGALALCSVFVGLGCRPRVGPAHADFEHVHEVKYQPLLDPELSPLSTSTPVAVLSVEDLPMGFRKRVRGTRRLVADPKDPLNRRKMKREKWSAIEASRSYPSLAEPHRVVGALTVGLKIRYKGFIFDDEEIAAEFEELTRYSTSVAQDVAREHGANAIVAVKDSFGKSWWRHPQPASVCRDRGKRCVIHAIKYNLLRVSDGERVVPSAAQLLELEGQKGWKAQPARPMKNGKLTLPIKRHHCYRLVAALEKDAKLPAKPSLLNAQAIRRVHLRFALDDIFDRSRDVGGFGCSSKTMIHDAQMSGYDGLLPRTNKELDASVFQGVVFQLLERRMDPQEATRYFCRECKQVAQRCGYRRNCQALRQCLRRRQQPVSSCKSILDLR